MRCISIHHITLHGVELVNCLSVEQPMNLEPNYLIAITGDKGGVGKSTLTALLVEWLLFTGRKVQVIDADPNQTTQTWLDKCREKGR